MLELTNISKTYPSPDGLHKTTVLSDINLFVSSGDSLAIIGPSGSGKSTLLNLIGTLDKPSSGKIIFNNQDVTELDEKQTAELRNQQMGFIFSTALPASPMYGSGKCTSANIGFPKIRADRNCQGFIGSGWIIRAFSTSPCSTIRGRTTARSGGKITYQPTGYHSRR